jgi:hypothetical protein
MKWVKIGQIQDHISISEQKVRELVKNGVFVEGKHFVRNKHIKHLLFNLEEIEKWLLQDVYSSTPKDIQNIVDKIVV